MATRVQPSPTPHRNREGPTDQPLDQPRWALHLEALGQFPWSVVGGRDGSDRGVKPWPMRVWFLSAAVGLGLRRGVRRWQSRAAHNLECELPRTAKTPDDCLPSLDRRRSRTSAPAVYSPGRYARRDDRLPPIKDRSRAGSGEYAGWSNLVAIHNLWTVLWLCARRGLVETSSALHYRLKG
jgi:hypothetical protein